MCWSCHEQPLLTNPMQAPDTNHTNRRWARATSPPPCLLTRASEARVLANSKRIARNGLTRTSAASTPTAGWSEMSKARSISIIARLRCKRLELVWGHAMVRTRLCPSSVYRLPFSLWRAISIVSHFVHRKKACVPQNAHHVRACYLESGGPTSAGSFVRFQSSW